jgi:hypothetical protein
VADDGLPEDVAERGRERREAAEQRAAEARERAARAREEAVRMHTDAAAIQREHEEEHANDGRGMSERGSDG